ncbi:MAG: hypothetical protein ACM31C_31305 [Acidobacteriota bacterium]
MTDIVVRRCKLHIRRTSGWAWGASPDELIRAATRAIPQLLAARLPALEVPADSTIVLDRPVRVQLAATARQLAALGDGTTGTQDVVELRARIEDEVSAAVAAAIATAGVASPSVSRAERDEPAERLALEAELAGAEAPRRAARAWFRAGELDAVLARLEPTALARLHELLLGDAPAADEPAPAVSAIVERAAYHHTSAATTPLERVQRRIAVAAETIDEMPSLATPQLRAAIDRVIPLEPDVAAGVAASRRRDEPALARSAPEPACELAVRSVLPFLLLSPLHHAGWLDQAATLLELHGCEGDAFALAAGLAAKVLDPLERGWSRSHADRLALAAFAGRSEPIADAEIAAAAARLRPVLAALDAGLRAVIVRARRPVPVALWRDERGWYLLDGDGTVVLGASTALRDVLAAAPAAPIVVPARFAEREVFDAIDFANARFITDAPPSRGDAWRSFAGTSRRLYTNDTATPAGKLAALTAHLDHSLALAEELAEVLAERPAIPRDPLTAFDATCTLAATAALADIGARLFPAEPTTPVLALTRFRDLDARVTFGPQRIRVRVPLGQRHADLLHHGVLGELANVPWLAGCTIDLGGG